MIDMIDPSNIMASKKPDATETQKRIRTEVELHDVCHHAVWSFSSMTLLIASGVERLERMERKLELGEADLDMARRQGLDSFLGIEVLATRIGMIGQLIYIINEYNVLYTHFYHGSSARKTAFLEMRCARTDG